MMMLQRIQVIIRILFLFPFGLHAYQNVYRDTLQPCSQDGMALTGYTRTGYCVDQNDDSGSHHICIDVSSTNGGNFCTVTGQSDWCSSQEMTCNNSDDDEAQYCPIQNWCVCQWAFATYLQNAGGCDQIQDIICDSINLEALKSYARVSRQKKYREALNCVTQRCKVTYSAVTKSRIWIWSAFMVLLLTISSFTIWCFQKRYRHSFSLKERFVDEEVNQNYGSSLHQTQHQTC